VLGGCPESLFKEGIFPAVRRLYESYKDSKNLTDNIPPDTFKAFFEIIAKGMKENTEE